MWQMISVLAWCSIISYLPRIMTRRDSIILPSFTVCIDINISAEDWLILAYMIMKTYFIFVIKRTIRLETTPWNIEWMTFKILFYKSAITTINPILWRRRAQFFCRRKRKNLNLQMSLDQLTQSFLRYQRKKRKILCLL